MREAHVLVSLAMRQTYTLILPIFAFREQSGRVITVPAGAELDCLAIEDRKGIGVAFWEGDRILVFFEDILKNGLRFESAGA
jgi:hypothetical protein